MSVENDNNQERYINNYLLNAFKALGKTQSEIIKDLNKSQPYVSALINGKKKVGKEIAKQLAELYGFDEGSILTGEALLQGSFSMTTAIRPSENIDLEISILSQKIKELTKKKTGSTGEGRLISDSSLVEATQYIVPVKGQAGLNKAFFYPDEYIEEHFERELILVKPSERGSFLKIEVDGNSMPGVLDPGDWARCEEIPKIDWMHKNIFKPKKVYCLFHNKRGILFKRISKVVNDIVTLSSDNSDKAEYPDEEFNLIEFSKILIVRKVEKEL